MCDVRLDHLTKIFGKDVVAVNDVSITFPDRKISCLLGPSGCGKTTTMRIIAGLERPTSGRVFFDDEDVTEVPPQKRQVAMVFQFPVVFKTMNVYKNIAFPLIVKKYPAQEIRKKVKDVAETLNLEECLDQMPSKLDMSSLQRVAIARAIITEARVYLFDEPLSSVEPELRIELRRTIRDVSEKLGQTVIYVTHDQTEALTIGDMIAVMRNGRIIQFDTPERVYLRPKDTFVAWFIGNPGMNFIDCDIVEKKGKIYLDAGVFQYDVTQVMSKVNLEKTKIKRIIMGIRPEHITVNPKKDELHTIKGKVDSVEKLGNVSLIYVSLDKQVTLKVKVSKYLTLKPNDEIWLGIPLDKIRLFDKESSELLL